MRYSKPALFFLCSIPFLALAYGAYSFKLGANPVETITHETGEWGLRFLLITLAVTPVRQIFGWHVLIRYRRMLGLFAFFYVCIHFSTFLVLDHFFDWRSMLDDIIKKNYILVGFLSFVLMIPLAATSTNKMVRRLGGANWRRLHRLVYACAILGVLHFLWLVKSDITEPMIYILILAALLGYRIYKRFSSR